MDDFKIIVLSVLASILWLPALLSILVLKYRFGSKISNFLWLVLPSQLLATVALVFLAQFIGLLNPAGYILGITFLVSIVGAIVVLKQRSANPSFKRDWLKPAP
jgi:hypothetical protein